MTEKSIPQPIGDRSTESTFIVDPLLPTREIHLIAGGSGVGKSTLACQIAIELQAGGQFFGHRILSPQKIAYLAFDRSPLGMRRTFERTLGRKDIPFPFYSSYASPEFRPIIGPINKIDKLLQIHPDTDVIITDGIGMALKGDSASLSNVAQFVQTMALKLIDYPRDLTMIALHMIGKTKKGNEYTQAREKIHGSVGWAGTTETCILIEPKDETPGTKERLITMCARNGGELALDYIFTDKGELIPNPPHEPLPKNQREVFLMDIEGLSEGEHSYDALKLLMSAAGVSKATLQRWLDEAIERKMIMRGMKGIYLKGKSHVQ